MQPISYAHHQFPAEVIQHAIWLYLRFTLSYRDVEELLSERGIETSYETIRRRGRCRRLIPAGAKWDSRELPGWWKSDSLWRTEGGSPWLRRSLCARISTVRV
jgi:transposase-like protein